MEYIISLLFFVFGCLLGFFISKPSNRELNNLSNKNKLLDSELKEYIKTLAIEKTKYDDLNQKQANFKQEFKNLVYDIFEEQKKSISLEQVKTIDPVKEEMEKIRDVFDKNIKDMLKNSTETKASIEEQLKYLSASTGNLQKEANDLVNALKNKKQQGSWGEFQLERIFEILGFKEGIEYQKEVFTKDEFGQIFRPDYVLNLPNDRKVIIDSKLSLESYIKYVNSDNEQDKKIFLKEFINATKKHIDSLSSKQYQSKIKNSDLDYVFMFMPLEHAYLIALEEDSSLYQYAFDNNVAFVTPSLLLPMMRTIDVLLKIEKRDKNIDEVITMINKLYEKYVSFIESFDDIGKKLNLAQKSYDNSLGRLSIGAGNMSSWFSKIKKRSGISSNKEIAISFDKDEDE